MYCYAACTVYKVVIVIAYMSGPVNCRYYSTSGPAIIRKLPLLDDIETTKCSTETMTYRQTDRHTNKQTVKGSNFQFIFSLFPSISTSFSLPCFTLTETHSLLGLQWNQTIYPRCPQGHAPLLSTTAPGTKRNHLIQLSYLSDRQIGEEWTALFWLELKVEEQGLPSERTISKDKQRDTIIIIMYM